MPSKNSHVLADASLMFSATTDEGGPQPGKKGNFHSVQELTSSYTQITETRFCYLACMILYVSIGIASNCISSCSSET